MLNAECSTKNTVRRLQMKIPFVSKTKTHCRHQTKDGKQCNATLQKGKDYCFFHDPDRKEERTAARRQGGITRTRRGPLSLELAAMPLKQSADVGQFLGRLVTQICLGNVEVRQGTGIAFITTCMMKAFDRAQRDAENAVRGPLPGKRSDKMLAELPNPSESSAASLLSPRHMNSPDAFAWPPASALSEALRSHNPRRSEPDEINGTEPDAKAGTAEPKTVPQTVPGKGAPQSHPSAAGSTDSTSTHKLETRNLKLETAPQTLPSKGGTPSGQSEAPLVDDSSREQQERRTREIKEWKELQEHQMKLYGCCSPDLSFNLPPGAENEAGRKARATGNTANANAYGNTDFARIDQLEIHPGEPRTGNLKFIPASRGLETVPGDMARKKHNAQDLERKKEIAYALAPTTMKYSMFNEEGLVVERPHASPESRARASATQPSQKTREPGPQLDYDNQPSPIPGLQNRHLNYQKYMGAPVSYLKRLGFVFPRRRWQLW
jgi:hypothetical protein